VRANPPLERTAAAVYVTCGRASRVRRHGRSTALRYPAMGRREVTIDQLISGVLPQFFPAHWLEHPGIAFAPFPSRIRIGYVLRQEAGYGYVMEDELAALALPLQDLHAAALKNLAKLPSASITIGRVPGGAEGWIAATDDNFAAARILLPEVQREFRQALGEDFLVAIACRDDCFCWSLSQAAERQEEHARKALEAFTNDHYNLTPDILLFRNGGFELHRQQIAG
jgi:uncharacterized protein YtpQ (UPF0354 family)